MGSPAPAGAALAGLGHEVVVYGRWEARSSDAPWTGCSVDSKKYNFDGDAVAGGNGVSASTGSSGSARQVRLRGKNVDRRKIVSG